MKAELYLFPSLVLPDYRIPVCAQLVVMIVIAGRLSLLGFVFKPVSWLAGDSRLRQTFSLRIHLVEGQSLSPIWPSTIIVYFRSPEASLSTSTSRSIAGPIVFSLDRNKPVTWPEAPVRVKGRGRDKPPSSCHKQGRSDAEDTLTMISHGVEISITGGGADKKAEEIGGFVFFFLL